MAFEFRLPDIGEGLTEATVVTWHVRVGDEIALDGPLVEVETDKAVVEIPSPHAGAVLHLGAAEGEVLPVGEILVVIGEKGEQWEPGSAPVSTTAAAQSRPAAPIVGTLDDAEDVIAAPPVASGPVATGTSTTRALPMVRRLAARLGVDLASVEGTGPAGRITRADVEAAARAIPGDRRERMSPTRRAIARNLEASWREIPHVTTYGVAAAEALLAERRRHSEELGSSVPLEALLISRIAPLLRRHADFNSAVDGDEIVRHDRVDIGVAVAAPSGLLVVVVRSALERTVPELAAEVRGLAEAARDRTITVEQMRGATFTISNIGAVGGGYGTPIIPFGTSAILSVGRADERPVVRDGQLEVGREFPLSLSYDHRLIDGAAGRAFMADLVAALES